MEDEVNLLQSPTTTRAYSNTRLGEQMRPRHDSSATLRSIFSPDSPVAVTESPDAVILKVARRSYDDKDDDSDDLCPTVVTDSSIAQRRDVSGFSRSSVDLTGIMNAADLTITDLRAEFDTPCSWMEQLDEREFLVSVPPKSRAYDEDSDGDHSVGTKGDHGIQIAANGGDERACDDDEASTLSSVRDSMVDHPAGAPEIAAARDGRDRQRQVLDRTSWWIE
jgi:hypothetical protein